MRVSLDAQSASRLATLDPDRMHWFACEPHGKAPLHMTYVFAAFGHLGELPERIARKMSVMGHWLILLLPFACQLCQAVGVTFSAHCTVRRALQLGAHMSLCPSGLRGKNHAMMLVDEHNLHGSGKPVIFVVRRRRLGFIRLAVQCKAAITLVLSPNEDRAFSNVAPLRFTRIPYFTLMFGYEWLVRPCCAVEVRVGTPIDTGGFDWSNDEHIQKLTDLYYTSLEQLAEPDYRIEYQ